MHVSPIQFRCLDVPILDRCSPASSAHSGQDDQSRAFVCPPLGFVCFVLSFGVFDLQKADCGGAGGRPGRCQLTVRLTAGHGTVGSPEFHQCRVIQFAISVSGVSKCQFSIKPTLANCFELRCQSGCGGVSEYGTCRMVSGREGGFNMPVHSFIDPWAPTPGGTGGTRPPQSKN